jgi:hypothetical protein
LQLYVTMSRPTLRWLERWRPVRALIDFHSIVAAHVYLGKATFLLAWVSSVPRAAVQLCALRCTLAAASADGTGRCTPSRTS